MDRRQLEPVPAFAAAVIVALAAADAHPALRGAPLLVLTCCAAVQIDRELAHALAPKKLFPAAAVMNLLMPIVLLHAAYFRAGAESALLELLACFVLAMYVLVVVAALLADTKINGLLPALRDLALSHLIGLVVGGGLACAMFVQIARWPEVAAPGSALVAVILAAAWLGAGVEAWLRAPAVEAPAPGRPAADLAAVAVPLVALPAGVLVCSLAGDFSVAHAAVLGLLVGVVGWVGRRGVERLQRFCEVRSFRFTLPHQIAFLQATYERTCRYGLTEYAAWLALVFPVCLAYLKWVAA